MPDHGAVQLLNVDTSAKISNPVKKWFFTPSAAAKNQALKANFGDGAVPAVDLNSLLQKPLFDMNTYGSPLQLETNGLSLNSKFTASYDMTLGNKLGFFNGGFTMRFTINGQTFPDIPMLTVKTGDLVKIHINNVIPHETYDVAFAANNPGIWMMHCHILGHAANGMDMMVNYEGVTTPYSVGQVSGNLPD
jgi:FtsP/CotA-like multicopper oxidase with cupredoxin domain